MSQYLCSVPMLLYWPLKALNSIRNKEDRKDPRKIKSKCKQKNHVLLLATMSRTVTYMKQPCGLATFFRYCLTKKNNKKLLSPGHVWPVALAGI